MKWKLALSDAWWPSLTCSFPTTKLCSKTARPLRQCASSALWIAYCLPQAASGEPSRVQLRSAGPASAVAWMLRGHAGEVPFVVLAHTSDDGEWSVLWHVPVEAHRVEGGKNFMMRIYHSEVKTPQTLTYDQAWAPMKRLASVMEQTPEDTSLTLRCRVSRHAIDAPCENLSSLLPVLWCTRLD